MLRDARAVGVPCVAAAWALLTALRAARQVNDALDKLAHASKRDEKVLVMRPLLQRMEDSEQLAWLCRIILKGAAKTVLRCPVATRLSCMQ